MTEPNVEPLSADARALLDAAREGLAPDAGAVRRMRANVGVAVGAGAGVGIGVKLALVAAVAAAGAGAWFAATREATPRVVLTQGTAQVVASAAEPSAPAQSAPSAPAQSAPSAAAQAAPSASAQAAPSASAQVPPSTPAPMAPSANAAAPAARAETPAKPAPTRATPSAKAPARVAVHDTPVRAPASVARAATASPVAADGDSTLAREVELVDLAMTSLRKHDPRTALAAVRRHAAETGGRGQLAEDAAAIEVEALCQLHDPSTADKLAAFDTRYPRSAQRSRLSTECP